MPPEVTFSDMPAGTSEMEENELPSGGQESFQGLDIDTKAPTENEEDAEAEIEERAPPSKLAKGKKAPEAKPAAKKAPPAAKASKPAPAEDKATQRAREEAPEEESEETTEEGEEEDSEGKPKKAEKPAEEEEPADITEEEIEVVTKIDGKERVELVKYKDLVRAHQLQQASHRRFEEAAQLKRGFENMMAYFRKDPIGTLRQIVTHDFGGTRDAREKAEAYVTAILDKEAGRIWEEEQLPPQERELRRARRELDEIKAERARLEAEQKEAEIEARTESFRQQRAKEIRGALVALKERFAKADVKIDAHLAKQIDLRMWQHKDRGIEISAQDAAEDLLREREHYLTTYLDQMPPEAILARRPDLVHAASRRSLRTAQEEEAATLAGESEPASDEDQETPPAQKGKQPIFTTFEELQEDIRAEQRRKGK